MHKRNDLARLWLEMEHELFPTLSFDAIERVLYYYLFSQTHLQGRRTVRLSLPQIARATQLSWYMVFHRVNQLRAKGCLRTHHRNQAGSVLELVLPRQVLGPKHRRAQKRQSSFDSVDCTTDRRARRAILRRERGHCFYCLRQITRTAAVLDHVIPRSRGGSSSFRNMVACCRECNFKKGMGRASNFLREIFRYGRLSSTEFSQRIAALTRLSRGNLRISLPS